MPKREDSDNEEEEEEEDEKDGEEKDGEDEDGEDEDGEEDIEDVDDDIADRARDNKVELKINDAKERLSSDFTSYYENARLIGDRTAHICNGAPIYVDKKQINIPHLEYMTPIQAASMEMLTGNLAFMLARTHLDGSIDIYTCDELENVLSAETTERIMKTF